MAANVDEYKRECVKSFISCLHFATEAHKHQKRKDVEKTPYINHPIGVAYILSEEAELPIAELLMGCLLHDTVEDTDVVIENINTKFGKYIGDLVQEVTDDKTLPKHVRKELQIVHAHSSSPQAKLVKLADKLYNLRDLERSLPVGWSEERRQDYFEWAFQVCNGLRGVCPKIEENLDALFIRKGLVEDVKRLSSNPVDIPHLKKLYELKILVSAADFAARHHRSHFIFDVKNGEPYINHLVSVAHFLSEEGQIEDTTVLCAAFLCDVVGKANVSMDEIVATFGIEVGDLVKELTFDHSKTLIEQLENKIIKARTMSEAAKTITLATVSDDLECLERFQPEGWTDFCVKYLLLSRKLLDILTGIEFFFELQDKLEKIIMNHYKDEPKKTTKKT